MPTEEWWTTYFDPRGILAALGVDDTVGDLLDVGCGYGTFLIPAATMISGTAIGVDIDPEMIAACRRKIAERQLANVVLLTGDVASPEAAQALAPYRGRIDYVTLFNILHAEEPVTLLRRVAALLSPSGRVGVIHWKREDTPRGPSMEIRPTPEQIAGWAAAAGLAQEAYTELPPYHFGLVLRRSA